MTKHVLSGRLSAVPAYGLRSRQIAAGDKQLQQLTEQLASAQSAYEHRLEDDLSEAGRQAQASPEARALRQATERLHQCEMANPQAAACDPLFAWQLEQAVVSAQRLYGLVEQRLAIAATNHTALSPECAALQQARRNLLTYEEKLDDSARPCLA